MHRQWTAISYNWSLGRTDLTVFTGPPDHDPARKFFETSHPGEVILALIAGAFHHGKTYPLTIEPPMRSSISIMSKEK